MKLVVYYYHDYFQIMALNFDGPNSVFEEPSSFIFEEAKFDLHNSSGHIIQVSLLFSQ